MSFYVYIHRRATDGRVFYVGKGKGRRAWVSVGRSAYWTRIHMKHGRIVEIVESGMQEWWALEMEREQIALHGRDLLCNLTDGGETSAGYSFTDEAKAKIAAGNRGKRRTPEQLAQLRQVFGTEEHRQKMREALSRPGVKRRQSEGVRAARAGRALSQREREVLAGMNTPEVRERVRATLADPEVRRRTNASLSRAKKGKPASPEALAAAALANRRPVKCIDSGVTFDSLTGAVEWLRSGQWPKAAHSALIAACTGRRGVTQAYGYRWAYS